MGSVEPMGYASLARQVDARGRISVTYLARAIVAEQQVLNSFKSPTSVSLERSMLSEHDVLAQYSIRGVKKRLASKLDVP